MDLLWQERRGRVLWSSGLGAEAEQQSVTCTHRGSIQGDPALPLAGIWGATYNYAFCAELVVRGRFKPADVAELADALDSGSSGR